MELVIKHKYNNALLNWYNNRIDHMVRYNDDEVELGDSLYICSASFGW